MKTRFPRRRTDGSRSRDKRPRRPLDRQAASDMNPPIGQRPDAIRYKHHHRIAGRMKKVRALECVIASRLTCPHRSDADLPANRALLRLTRVVRDRASKIVKSAMHHFLAELRHGEAHDTLPRIDRPRTEEHRRCQKDSHAEETRAGTNVLTKETIAPVR